MTAPPATGGAPTTAAPDAEERRTLERTWGMRPGLRGWLSASDHRTVGRRFLITSFAFFLLGGLEAVAMRLQLAAPENSVLGPDLYNQMFSMHGTTMMFLFAVPVMQALGLYLVPLMVGTREVPFPRLVAYAYWMFLFGGIFLYAAFAVGSAPDTGWFSYVPLSGPEFTPGKRADVWAQLITFTEVSALVLAVTTLVTILKLRAPGMSLNRMPLFVWAILVTSVMVVFGMPAVMLDSTLLILDRLVGTRVFDPSAEGDPLLWQHLFWFFGHPEVYIIFIPALGIVSSIVSAAARRPILGYPLMVFSLIATGFLGFGLWVHHMFATNVPDMAQSFFMAASVLIAVPSGVQIFCWTATLWDGRPRVTTPLLFVAGFIVLFVLGGITGVMLGSVPFDLQVHDTFFVVAHFHYVLIGGAVFPLFGGFYHWWPKFTGRTLSERAGRWNFWLFFVGFNVAFFPMHLLGLEGMPRRVYTYPAALGWEGLNLLSTGGGILIVASVAVFLGNVAWSLRRGPLAGNDPWGAETLEWATTSPPPAYNFLRPPVVRGRDPLWGPEPLGAVTGLRPDVREVLVTEMLDARPDHRLFVPEPSIWPFLAALVTSAIFVGSIFTPWAVVWGLVPAIVAFTGWFWPKPGEKRPKLDEAPPHPAAEKGLLRRGPRLPQPGNDRR